MKLPQGWKPKKEKWMRIWKYIPAAVLLTTCVGVSAETFLVEKTSPHFDFGPGMNFEEAVAAANDNAGPDIILFSNQNSPVPGEAGYSKQCFQFDDPLVFTDKTQVVGVDELADLYLDELGQRVPVRSACLVYTGVGTAVTFNENAAGSNFRIDSLHGAEQAFQLCALGLKLEAWLWDFDTALGLCGTSTVEADANLIMTSRPESITVLNADLPTDANLDLDISTTTGATNDGPLLLNLEASECGGKVRLSGNDIRGGLQVEAKGCVDLLVDQFTSNSVYEESYHLPWLTASSWSPVEVDLVPSITIQNSLLANVSSNAVEPLIKLDGVQFNVAHSTLTANSTASGEIIRMANTNFVANHSIIAGNDATALSATLSTIELIYSMLDSMLLDASSMTSDGISEAWLLNATQPELETFTFMPSSSSLALNAGDIGLTMGVGDTPLTDFYGQQRILDGAIDIGALERNLRPMFNESAATAELMRQRSAGESELVLDINRYMSDPDGDVVDVDFVVAQQGVVYREDLGQLFIPSTSTGVLARIWMDDEHGGESVGFLNAKSSFKEAEKNSDSGGGATNLALLLLLLVARRMRGSGFLFPVFRVHRGLLENGRPDHRCS